MLKPNRSNHLAPLITRLRTWGYDIDAVKPVAKVVDKLDSATLSLIERLVHDLTQLNECSHDLRNQVSSLTGELDREKQLLDRLRVENQRLRTENCELRAQVEERGIQGLSADGQKPSLAIFGEEQVQQWRAQSMHQLQELEIMNQALRSTLNLQTCAPPTVNQQTSGLMTISKPLEPRTEPVSPPAPKTKAVCVGNQKKLDLMRVAETRCKKMEEDLQRLTEGHATLQEQLASTQLQISSKDREIQELQLANRKYHPNELKFVGKGISFLRSDLESIASELLSLQQIYEKEIDVHISPFSKTTLDLPDKSMEIISRHNIDYALRDRDVEQKVSSINGSICNLNQKEDLPAGIMALAAVPEDMRSKHLERPSSLVCHLNSTFVS